MKRAGWTHSDNFRQDWIIKNIGIGREELNISSRSPLFMLIPGYYTPEEIDLAILRFFRSKEKLKQ